MNLISSLCMTVVQEVDLGMVIEQTSKQKDCYVVFHLGVFTLFSLKLGMNIMYATLESPIIYRDSVNNLDLYSRSQENEKGEISNWLLTDFSQSGWKLIGFLDMLIIRTSSPCFCYCCCLLCYFCFATLCEGDSLSLLTSLWTKTNKCDTRTITVPCT